MSRRDLRQRSFDSLTDAATNLVGALFLLVIRVQGLARSAPAPRPTLSGSHQTRNVGALVKALRPWMSSWSNGMLRLAKLRVARKLREQAALLLGRVGSGEHQRITLAPAKANTRRLFQSLQIDRIHAEGLQGGFEGLVVQL